MCALRPPPLNKILTLYKTSDLYHPLQCYTHTMIGSVDQTNLLSCSIEGPHASRSRAPLQRSVRIFLKGRVRVGSQRLRCAFCAGGVLPRRCMLYAPPPARISAPGRQAPRAQIADRASTAHTHTEHPAHPARSAQQAVHGHRQTDRQIDRQTHTHTHAHCAGVFV